MKYFLLISFFILGNVSYAFTCSDNKIDLYGEVVFKNADKAKSLFAPIPEIWTVNNNRFQSLYLNNKSADKSLFVTFNVSSRKYNKKFDLKVSNTANSNDLYKINNSNFLQMFLPSRTILPVVIEMRVRDKAKEICKQTYKLEVIL